METSYINIWMVLFILFLHWIFDFVLQTDAQAKNKSTSVRALLGHTIMYSLFWNAIIIWIIIILNKPITMLYFVPITFVCHTITDYFTSKLNKYLWDKKDTHNFFVSIGFDQWLHIVQLLLTYQFLNTH